MAFTPSAQSRKYFDALIKRLQDQRQLPVRVTMREAFDVLVKYAQAGDPDTQTERMRAMLGR